MIKCLNIKWGRRLFRSEIILLIFAIFLFPKCINKTQNNSSAGESAIKKGEPVTINFIGHWLHEGLRETLVRDVAREYEFTHQEVNINLKFPDEIYFNRQDPMSNQKFVASIINEEHPAYDIVWINNDYQAIGDAANDLEWAKKNLVDFSEIPEFRKNTLPELLSDSIKKLWHGIIPGPFIEGANWALWCNNVVAKKMGIEVKQFDMTYDDFLGYIKAVYEYNKSHNDYIIPLFEANDWKTSNVISSQLYASALVDANDFFTDVVSERKFKAWEKTLKAFEQLASYHILSDKCDTMSWEVGKKLILEDKCLFFSNGSWMYNIWLGMNKSKMKDLMPAEYPAFKPTNVYPGAYQIIWGVLKNAPHREAAVKFLLAWNTPAVANQWDNYTKCPTGIKGNLSFSSFGKDQFALFTSYIGQKYGTRKYAVIGNSEHILGISKKSIPNYYEEVLKGEMTADEAIKKMKKQLGR